MPDYKSGYLKKEQENRLKPLIEKLTNMDSFFKDFPFELLEMREKAELLNFLLNNATVERQIVSNICKSNVDRNFGDFRIPDEIAKKFTNEFLNEHPDFGPWDILRERGENRIIIENHTFSDQEILKKLIELNAVIKWTIFDEVYSFKEMGIGYSNLGYIRDYIDCVSDSILHYLMYRVIINPSSINKKTSIDCLSDKLDELYNLVNFQLEQKRAEQQKENKLTSKTLTEYFTAYRHHYSIYHEELDIIDTLISEIHEDKVLFCPLKDEYRAAEISLSDERNKKSKDIITENNHIYGYKKKLEETRTFIDIMFKYYDRQCSSDCLLDIKVYFREIYMSKAKYKKKQAMAMVRNYLMLVKKEGFQPFEKHSQYMFLSEKIRRGYFRELGVLDLYVAILNIHKKLYNLLLKTYLLYEFLDVVDLINSINNQLLQTIQHEMLG